ncbi:hypothetical protein FSP39_008156 [Pinctada imbricata]|uniref:Uncharacterized protein n=1 Tax=Pinctada imbricata TaxID=66713 RepID=A0AA88XVY6_PINIB|nr:hypothetical protein FSP39_008156 [Pinctada imbricata]
MSDSTVTLISDSGEPEAQRSTQKHNSRVEHILSCISEGFTRAKADQILRLLQDQEELNNKLYDCEIKKDNSDSEDDSDTLSDSSIKETEKRLALRLSLHKQVGGRSKTSMGFYNDVDRVNYSSDEDSTQNMADTDRPINTRINRPKSSYVRRRTTINGDSTDENMDNEQVVAQRRSPPTSPNNEIVDSSQYDRYAHVRTPAPGQHPGVQRQRTRVRGFCEDPAPEPPSNLQRQRTVHDISAQNISSDEARDEFNSSPRQRHRRQQFRHARANRPGSENVYLVRQRTESNMLKARTNYVRPKSDKTLIQQAKQNKMLSIDTNPLQASQNTGFQPVASSIQASQSQAQQRYQSYAPPSQRPKSRRSQGRQDLSLNTRGPGVISGRTQPIGVMKLPPLDPTVAKRAERIVLAAHETCA